MDIVMMNPLGSTAIGLRILTKRHALGAAAEMAPAGAIVGDNDLRRLLAHLFARGAECGC